MMFVGIYISFFAKHYYFKHCYVIIFINICKNLPADITDMHITCTVAIVYKHLDMG